MREDIKLTDGMLDMLYKIGEGNPGATTVLTNMLNDPIGFMDILSLDDMNIRGSQIWYGFKDYCGEDFELFKEAIKTRDEKMIKAINICVAKYNDEKHKAVRYGASAPNGRKMLSEEEVEELSGLSAIRNPKLKTK